MKNILVMVLATGLVLFITGPKLHKMCQIKGWIAGTKTTQETISVKWHQTPDQHPKKRDVFWIAWQGADIKVRGSNRINLQREKFEALQVADTIAVVRLPDDPVPYLRQGIFVSRGNFVLDIVLLLGEIYFAVRAFGRWRLNREDNLSVNR